MNVIDRIFKSEDILIYNVFGVKLIWFFGIYLENMKKYVINIDEW